MNPKPGEVWLADLGLAAKARPILIISRFDPDPPRAIVTYIPLTTQYRKSQYEIELPHLPFLHQKSYANIQGIASIPKVRLERKLGSISEESLKQVKKAVCFALDLPTLL